MRIREDVSLDTIFYRILKTGEGHCEIDDEKEEARYGDR